ncbi:glycosyltransferase family 2 protein [Streptomyces aurantiacus]|uniref:Glycosyl transferase n=1 Tax=Streptomyces aurantiacus TaxID=47760 RepID=A0A7G1NYJ8_9ACTN|nr:glycosyltransferase [Streptomyces aurantiacus]BCL26657.1 glycosyl transferase [Streptomyces aurantiacus]
MPDQDINQDINQDTDNRDHRTDHGSHGTGKAGPDRRTTVAVITRDRPESALRTLDRLAALPERPPVVVVDNGSDDAVTAALRGHPVRAEVLSPPGNTGALGRNLAVRHASTPYVAFSDDDSWWRPGALSRAADLLDTHPRLGLLAARSLVGPEEAEDPLNALLADSPLPTAADLPGRSVLGFLGCACVVRRRAYLDAGGYHPLLFFGAEETLLAYDLAAAGWGVAYEPSVVAHHHPDPGGRPGRSVRLRRNALLTAWLRRPVNVALRHTGRLAASAVSGEAGAMTALREALVRAPEALRRRRRLPPRVERDVRLLEQRAARARPHAPGATGAHPIARPQGEGRR